ERVNMAWTFANPDAYWTFLIELTALGPVFRRLSGASLSTIRTAIDARLAPHSTGAGRITLPAQCWGGLAICRSVEPRRQIAQGALPILNSEFQSSLLIPSAAAPTTLILSTTAPPRLERRGRYRAHAEDFHDHFLVLRHVVMMAVRRLVDERAGL